MAFIVDDTKFSFSTSGEMFQVPPEQLIPQKIMSQSQLQENRDWSHSLLKIEECHKLAQGENIVVGILDSGIDGEHPDLKDQIAIVKDFTGMPSGYSDVLGHGTHTAGIIAASMNNTGLIGIAPKCKLVVGKILGDMGFAFSNWIATGIRWAIKQKVHILSLSIGFFKMNKDVVEAIKEAYAAGIYVVAAAGNSGPSPHTVTIPGSIPESICIGCIDKDLSIARFSSRGEEVDLVAPGVNINSTYPGGRYAVMSGTSMSTPCVAGVLALYLSYLLKNNKLFPSQAELIKLLELTSKDLGAIGKDMTFGYGMPQPLVMFDSVVNPIVPPSDVLELSMSDLKQKGIKKVIISL